MSEIEYRLHPIGIIRSPLKARAGAPRQGSEGAPDAWIEINPAVAEALHGRPGQPQAVPRLGHVSAAGLDAGPDELSLVETRGFAQAQVYRRGGTRLRATLVWTDPPGVVAPVTSSELQLVHDLDLRITAPNGAVSLGNAALNGTVPDRVNNVEMAEVLAPAGGEYSVSVDGRFIFPGARQSYALVITGEFEEPQAPARKRAARH